MPAKSKTRSSANPKKPFSERGGQFLTLDEVADILAVTRRKVQRMIALGELRATKNGKLVRVHVDDLNQCIARMRGEA
jgi:excisionase family DNA binding protein